MTTQQFDTGSDKFNKTNNQLPDLENIDPDTLGNEAVANALKRLQSRVPINQKGNYYTKHTSHSRSPQKW